MGKVLVIYESITGNVKEMAHAIGEGVAEGNGEARVASVEMVTNGDLLEADGIIIGTYTSYGTLTGGLKTLFDRSYEIHGKLRDKVGSAFASSGGLGGGNETTVFALLQILLVHGMIIAGEQRSPHFGPVAIGKPGEKELASCRKCGKRVADLIATLEKGRG